MLLDSGGVGKGVGFRFGFWVSSSQRQSLKFAAWDRGLDESSVPAGMVMPREKSMFSSSGVGGGLLLEDDVSGAAAAAATWRLFVTIAYLCMYILA